MILQNLRHFICWCLKNLQICCHFLPKSCGFQSLI
ncbi:putative signal peptide protein [Puccinia sorghi]|uniref:Putative signal peptide protein n=1 Tax=Puccinia sorghi TaxID=27349 RepID=A0A0L6UU74_9BASI|nr:putative signal peptide protein [Puccinia sorghi]